MTDDLSIQDVAQRVRAARPPEGMSTRIVAIDGHGGAGKSTLAEELAGELGGARIVHTDDFASWEAKEDAGLEEIVPAPFVMLEGVSASREAFRPFLTF